MQNDFEQFVATSADWRSTLKQNNRRTYIVIFLFFAIYSSIGLLVDMYIYSASYPDATIPQLFYALVTLKLFPVATVILFCIAAISLWISYIFADKLMLLGTEYHQITPETATTLEEKQLYNVVEEMKVAAGLRYMPRVYIIDADYMNAFASGFSEKSAMVAITRGLMQKLNRDELQAVMAHELSHIRHLDIKITVTATLLANLTLMIIDMLFYSAMFSNRGRENSRARDQLGLIILILRYTLPLISIVLLMYLSRKRELMADAGCVQLMRNNEPLASALLKIQGDHEQHKDTYEALYQKTPHENVRREAYIYDPYESDIKTLVSLNDIFSTHPSLDERLRALGFKRKTQP